MNPKVDFYFDKAKKWQEEIEQLRLIALDAKGIGYALSEELKWGVPCYTFEEKNVFLIHVFKDYCAFLFFKGALLKDKQGILIQQTASVQAARQIRFTSLADIKKLKSVVHKYMAEAVELERMGAKVELKKTNDFEVPEELKAQFKKQPALKKAFESLTPGRQRGDLLYFAAAKQAKTRESRIEKYIPQILAGKGLDDK
ncbi:MAG: YdeI/OmpD-associated family protein [Bacteroidia bacterium]